jgi:hypothetical protein
METRHIKFGKWRLGCVCLWLLCSWLAIAGNNPGVAEYQVKAAYLYNFTKFTDWPASAFASSNAPIVIGIVGENPFGNTLDEIVKGEVVRDHPLVVKHLRAGDDLQGCQVLFICRSEKDRMALLLQKLKGQPVLTVSDAGDFAEQGGMVCFVLANETVKLEINQAVAEESSLQISSKLLKLAHIVKSN